jgi:fatty aldehyde-generating acyl-ACP reductase
MKRFSFSTTYRGNPQVAFDCLLNPQILVERMPYVSRIDVLKRPTPQSLIASWEMELDGAPFTWREEVQFHPEQEAVTFRMLKGDFQSFSGTWSVATDQDHVTVTLEAELDWGAPNLSQFVAQILDEKAEKAVRGMVIALGRSAVRQSIRNRKNSNRFGFIFHPLDLNLFAEGFGDEDLKSKRPAVMEKVMAWFPPFRRGIISGIRSEATGAQIEGDMLLLTLLPKHMLTLEDNFVLGRLAEAGRLGQRYGDKIVGLGAYAANVGRKGVYLSNKIEAAVTTGSCYTIAIAMEASLQASKAVGINLKEARVTVIGATGTIGRVCSELMAKEVRHLMLVARNQQRLEDLAQALDNQYPAKVAALADIDAAVSNADLIICSTNTPSAIVDLTKVRPGAVICDISRPRNVSEENALTRSDVLILDGGVVRPPGEMHCSFSFGLAPALAYACMAETMILTLENRFDSFSIGGNADLKKVEEISQLAQKHGFKLAGLRSFEKEVTDAQIKAVREARNGGAPPETPQATRKGLVPEPRRRK